VLGLTNPLASQGFLESFSYEGLGFSGIAMDAGVVVSDRLTRELSGSVRLDFGMFSPNVRVVFGLSGFRAQLNADEINQFEERLRILVPGAVTVNVGTIDWTDIELFADLQYMISMSRDFNFYVGFGVGVHYQDGDGAAINDTFVEDALDTILAGINSSVGFEVRAIGPLYWTAEVRGGLTSELSFSSARTGLLYRFYTPGTN